jgi:hypothetical protein
MLHTPSVWRQFRALLATLSLATLCCTAACQNDAGEGLGTELDRTTTDAAQTDTRSDAFIDTAALDAAASADTPEPTEDVITDVEPGDTDAADVPDLPDATEPIDAAVPDAALQDVVPDAVADTSVDIATDTAPDASDTPSDAGETSESDVPLEPEPFAACPAFDNGRSRGFISSQNLIEQLVSPVIVEASGIAASRTNPNVIYTHNDSGGEPEIFAIQTTNGHRLATYRLEGADTNDWEDIAVGPGPEPGVSYIYVGDIGDNGGNRENINVYRVREPAVPTRGTPPTVTLRDVEQLEFRYPDGGNNAETMMVDPVTGDLYVVGKDGSGTSPVYRASPPFIPFDRVVMELVTTLRFGEPPLEGRRETTAGDFSPSGNLIAIRTYDAIHIWRRPRGRTVDEAFASEPCDAPQVDEPQGEAICFDADSGGYFTLSEGRGQQLYYFAPR